MKEFDTSEFAAESPVPDAPEPSLMQRIARDPRMRAQYRRRRAGAQSAAGGEILDPYAAAPAAGGGQPLDPYAGAQTHAAAPEGGQPLDPYAGAQTHAATAPQPDVVATSVGYLRTAAHDLAKQLEHGDGNVAHARARYQQLVAESLTPAATPDIKAIFKSVVAPALLRGWARLLAARFKKGEISGELAFEQFAIRTMDVTEVTTGEKNHIFGEILGPLVDPAHHAAAGAHHATAHHAAAPASHAQPAGAAQHAHAEHAVREHHAQARVAHGATRPKSGPAAAGEERFYDLHLELLHNATNLAHATKAQALHALASHAGNISRWISAAADMHDSLRELRASSPVGAAAEAMAPVGEAAGEAWDSVKGFFTGKHQPKQAHGSGKVEMPDKAIWSFPLQVLHDADEQLRAGNVEEAIDRLNDAARAYRAAYQRLREYKERTESGAAAAVTSLQIAEAAGAISFSVVTGGLGSGVLGTAAMAGAGSGVYAAAQMTAGQTSEKAFGLRQHLDWKEILEHGAEEAINNFVGALVGGKLSELFMRKLGQNVLLKMGQKEVAALAEQARIAGGKLTPEVFVTGGWRFVARFLGGLGSAPVVTSVSTIVHGALNGVWPKTWGELIERVVKDLVSGAFFQVLLEGILHGHAAIASKSGEAHGGTVTDSGSPRGHGSSGGSDSSGGTLTESGPRGHGGEPPARNSSSSESSSTHESDAGAGSKGSAAPPPGVEVLEPGRWTAQGAPQEGMAKKHFVVDNQTGKKYLFKPNQKELYVDRAVERGMTGDSIGGRAKAAEVAAERLGIDTPAVKLVQYDGEVGSLQEWRETPGARSLNDIQREDAVLYRKVVASPQYQKLRSDLDAFDYLINNLDRNNGNLLVEVDARGNVENIVAIDHDLTFTAEAKRFIEEGWGSDLPEKYNRKMYENLKRMKADAHGFREAMKPFIKPQELESALIRLDVILQDIEAKIARVGEKGTFY